MCSRVPIKKTSFIKPGSQFADPRFRPFTFNMIYVIINMVAIYFSTCHICSPFPFYSFSCFFWIVYLLMIPFYLLVGLFAALLLALCELQRIFLLFLWPRVVSSRVQSPFHWYGGGPSAALWSALSMQLSSSWYSALRTLPTMASVHSQLCLLNWGGLPGSPWVLPSWATVWELSGQLQCSTC